MSSRSKETADLRQFGYSPKVVRTMNRLGMVATELTDTFIDGRHVQEPGFKFIPDTPLGRANRVADIDMLDWLGGVIDNAKVLSYRKFAKEYPELGPYQASTKTKLAVGVATIAFAGTAVEAVHGFQEIFQAFRSSRP